MCRIFLAVLVLFAPILSAVASAQPDMRRAETSLLPPAHPLPKPDQHIDTKDIRRTVIFGSLDAGRSTYVSVGFKRSLFDALDRSGFIVMVGAGAGQEEVKTITPTQQKRSEYRGQSYALAGYQWMLAKGAFNVMLGMEGEGQERRNSTHLSIRGGVRFQGDLWLHPTEKTLFTATVVAGSAKAHLWTRITSGVAVREQVFIGPEASLHLESDYKQWRAGLHLTGLKIGSMSTRLSAGWRADSDTKNGAYGTLTLYGTL